MSRHEASGTLPPALTDRYHSVAGQPAAALQGTAVAPLTLVDFIDARVREIDSERTRLMMVKEQLVGGGITISVDDLRRLLG